MPSEPWKPIKDTKSSVNAFLLQCWCSPTKDIISACIYDVHMCRKCSVHSVFPLLFFFFFFFAWVPPRVPSSPHAVCLPRSTTAILSTAVQPYMQTLRAPFTVNVEGRLPPTADTLVKPLKAKLYCLTRGGGKASVPRMNLACVYFCPEQPCYTQNSASVLLCFTGTEDFRENIMGAERELKDGVWEPKWQNERSTMFRNVRLETTMDVQRPCSRLRVVCQPDG